jgi:hypothetical protein
LTGAKGDNPACLIIHGDGSFADGIQIISLVIELMHERVTTFIECLRCSTNNGLFRWQRFRWIAPTTSGATYAAFIGLVRWRWCWLA